MQWKDSSWEEIEDLNRAYPSLNLEDKVVVEGAGDGLWTTARTTTIDLTSIQQDISTFAGGEEHNSGNEIRADDELGMGVKGREPGQTRERIKRASHALAWTQDFDMT